MLAERVTAPLGMSSTTISVAPEDAKRLAPGFTSGGDPAPSIAISSTLEGGGGLYSSASDLVRFLEANLGLRTTPLVSCLAAMHESRFPTNDPEVSIGLGWFILARPSSRISYHTGGSAGYRSFIGLDLEQQAGVVVLSNADFSPDDIGFHILDRSLALARFDRKEVAVDPKVFDALVGEYRLSPTATVTISTNEGRLMIQMTGTRTAPLTAESDTEYYLEVADIGIRFIEDQGEVNRLELTRQGRVQTAQRILDRRDGVDD